MPSPFLVVLAMLALAGCGENEGFISTPTLRAALKEAGFTDLRVVTRKRPAAEELSRRRCKEMRDHTTRCVVLFTTAQATIVAGPMHNGWPTLMAARWRSIATAKKAFERANNPETISHAIALLREYGALPAGFTSDMLRAARVCNVIMSSYNASDEASLYARFDRAVALLRKKC